jgi:hypothetical protein
MTDVNSNGETYTEWMAKVEAEVDRRTGLGVDDLPDCPTMDYFTDDLSPSEAADEIIEYAGG